MHEIKLNVYKLVNQPKQSIVACEWNHVRIEDKQTIQPGLILDLRGKKPGTEITVLLIIIKNQKQAGEK